MLKNAINYNETPSLLFTAGWNRHLTILLFVDRRHFRQVLKQQMADQDAQKQQQLKDKVRESEAAVEYDRQCKSQDFDSFVKKFNYLKQFRDDNKNVSILLLCLKTPVHYQTLLYDSV